MACVVMSDTGYISSDCYGWGIHSFRPDCSSGRDRWVFGHRSECLLDGRVEAVHGRAVGGGALFRREDRARAGRDLPPARLIVRRRLRPAAGRLSGTGTDYEVLRPI